MRAESEVAQLCPTLCDPMDCTCQAPLSMGFSRQDYWGGLPFPSPGDLPNPGIEPGSPTSQAGCLPFEPPGKPYLLHMGALLVVRPQVGEVFYGLMSTFQVLLLGLSSCTLTLRSVFSPFLFSLE